MEVVYEDEHLLVVNKAAGMVMHPSPGHFTGTLVNALLHRYGLPGVRLASVDGALSNAEPNELPGAGHVMSGTAMKYERKLGEGPDVSQCQSCSWQVHSSRVPCKYRNAGR